MATRTSSPSVARIRALEKGVSSSLVSLVVGILVGLLGLLAIMTTAGAAGVRLGGGTLVAFVSCMFGVMLVAASWAAYVVLSAMLAAEVADRSTDEGR